MSLRKIVMGTVTMSSVSMLRLLTQFFAIPILSRLLSVEDYGLIGIAMPFIALAMTLADAGIGMSLVRTPLSEKKIWSTYFWLSAGLGLLLMVLLALSAPLVAMLFGEPHLTTIIASLSLVIWLQALLCIPSAALQQSQRFKTIAAIEITAIFFSIGAALLMAMHGAGVWALVVQQLLFFLVRLVMSYLLSPFRVAAQFDLSGVKQHVRFGRDVLSVNLFSFLSRSSDNLIVGKIIDTVAVGIYSMAFQFVRLPIMLVGGPLQYVLYAQLTSLRDDKPLIGRTFLILTRLLATIIFPAIGMIAVAHTPIFTILLSAKWYMAGHVFMLAALGSAVQAVTGLCGTVRLVMGRTELELRSTVEFGLLWLTALFVASWFGLAAVAVSFSVAMLLYTPRSMRLVLPLIGCRSRDYLATFVLPVITTAICIGLYALVDASHALSNYEQVFMAMLLAMLGIGISGWMQRRFIREEIAFWRTNPR
ncbi:MAG: lipopolysaccharide biosynthesis protein [Pseudomonadota bacterium]